MLDSSKLSWREVFDASKLLNVNSWEEIVMIVFPTGYKYIAYQGIVRNFDYREICTVYDLI